MRSVTISRQTSATSRQGNYRVDLTIDSANLITPNLFVKQRVIKPDGTIDDTFAAVASPSEIEDIPELAPGSNRFFRDSKISLINSDSDYLNQVVQQILIDVQLTVLQMNELDLLTPSEIITVTESGISVDTTP
jgi:hypothetical protein